MTSRNQLGPSMVPPHEKKGDIELSLPELGEKTHLRETEKTNKKEKRGEGSLFLSMKILGVLFLCSQPPNHADGEHTQEFSSLQKRMEKIYQSLHQARTMEALSLSKRGKG